MADNTQAPSTVAPMVTDAAASTVPKGAKTEEYYRVSGIPDRFNNPGKCYSNGNPVFSNMLNIEDKAPATPSDQEWFQGYSQKPQNPIWRTSNNDYGARPPTVHTMPTTFNARTQHFTDNLGKCGMYRNHSLNTDTDKSFV